MTRTILPNRRYSENFDFEHAPDRGLSSIRYTATVGFGPDNKVAEVFLNSSKLGSGSDSSARDAAIAVSLALSYGAELTKLRHAMTRNEDGSASSPIGQLLDLLDDDEA